MAESDEQSPDGLLDELLKAGEQDRERKLRAQKEKESSESAKSTESRPVENEERQLELFAEVAQDVPELKREQAPRERTAEQWLEHFPPKQRQELRQLLDRYGKQWSVETGERPTDLHWLVLHERLTAGHRSLEIRHRVGEPDTEKLQARQDVVTQKIERVMADDADEEEAVERLAEVQVDLGPKQEVEVRWFEPDSTEPVVIRVRHDSVERVDAPAEKADLPVPEAPDSDLPKRDASTKTELPLPEAPQAQAVVPEEGVEILPEEEATPIAADAPPAAEKPPATEPVERIGQISPEFNEEPDFNDETYEFAVEEARRIDDEDLDPEYGKAHAETPRAEIPEPTAPDAEPDLELPLVEDLPVEPPLEEPPDRESLEDIRRRLFKMMDREDVRRRTTREPSAKHSQNRGSNLRSSGRGGGGGGYDREVHATQGTAAHRLIDRQDYRYITERGPTPKMRRKARRLARALAARYKLKTTPGMEALLAEILLRPQVVDGHRFYGLGLNIDRAVATIQTLWLEFGVYSSRP